ncbi:hypothetical protein FOA52_002419 [Chlamydomonas sp. UWO 241]|nr:hypothetical protein FOA52_002419 [Chlamydomonas sp. UWO 241]
MPSMGRRAAAAAALILLHAAAAYVAALKPTCVFDFDETLKLCGPVAEKPEECNTSKAPAGREVIDACVAAGYNIAMATASCKYDYVTKFITEQFGSPLDRDFVNSGCFTYCEVDKEFSLDKIADCQGEPRDDATFQCFMLFDDSWGNLNATRKRNVHFVKVDPAVGVTMSDFERGQAALRANCGAM